MSSTTLSVHTNKAVLMSFTFPLSDGSVDLTTPAILSVSDPTKFRATVNPDNNRQFAVVGLAATLPSAPASVSVQFGPGGPSDFITVAVAAPTKLSPLFGTPSSEVDVPSWA